MLICDVCQREFEIVVSIGGLYLCFECIMPYDEELSKCCSEKEYGVLGRRIRADVLHSHQKARSRFERTL